MTPYRPTSYYNDFNRRPTAIGERNCYRDAYPWKKSVRTIHINKSSDESNSSAGGFCDISKSMWKMTPNKTGEHEPWCEPNHSSPDLDSCSGSDEMNSYLPSCISLFSQTEVEEEEFEDKISPGEDENAGEGNLKNTDPPKANPQETIVRNVKKFTQKSGKENDKFSEEGRETVEEADAEEVEGSTKKVRWKSKETDSPVPEKSMAHLAAFLQACQAKNKMVKVKISARRLSSSEEQEE